MHHRSGIPLQLPATLRSLLPRPQHREAAVLEDLASALDAGVPVDRLAGAAGAGDPALLDLLIARGIILDRTDRAILAAAARSGTLTRALRERARARRDRAALGGGLLLRLLYPLGLAVMALVVGRLTAPVHEQGVRRLLVPMLPFLAVGVAAVLFRLGMGRLRGFPTNLPLLAPYLESLGSHPYLVALRGLHGAGITLLEAHPAAVAAVPVASLRARLTRADLFLQQGNPLGDALAQARALEGELRGLLADAEQVGALEDGLERAAQRVLDQARARGALLVRMVAGVVYALAAFAVLDLLLGFYAGLFASFSGR